MAAGRPKADVNESIMRDSAPLLERLDREYEICRLEVAQLKECYETEREQSLKQSGARYHSGVQLKFRKNKDKHTGVLDGHIRWSIGRAKDNKKDQKEKRGDFPITRDLHSCGEDGAYTKSNIFHAIPWAYKWEVELIYRYELEAHKIRKHLLYITRVRRLLRDFPQLPDIQDGPLLGLKK